MGKNQSKPKRKDQSRSIAWSFTFPSLDAIGRKKMSPGRENGGGRPHMEISQWLETLDLNQYAANFDRFSGVEDLLNFTESRIKELGVKNSAHRARIVSSLIVLRKKYDKCGGEKEEAKLQRHSVAIDGGRLMMNRNGGAGAASDLASLLGNVSQSKSLCNIKMDSSPEVSLDQIQLRKALEWELSLDARDLRSHAWYHGAIPRSRAEEIIDEDGDFLVRDCTSQPGNYVLSTRWKGQCLHFVINKVVLRPDTVYERIQFQFEDEAYDTVSDLITYYVGSGKVISALSGAKIQNPKNRFQPLSFYATKYAIQQQACLGSAASSPLTGSGNPRYNSINALGNHSPKRDAPPLPSKQRSLSLTPAELNEKLQMLNCGNGKSNSADGIVRDGNRGRFATNSLPRKTGTGAGAGRENGNDISRVISDPALSPCFERRKPRYDGTEEAGSESRHPPPKPSRIPSLPAGPDLDSRESIFSRATSGSDSGNGSGDSAQSSAAGDSNAATTSCGSGAVLRGVVIKNPRYLHDGSRLPASASSTTLKAIECGLSCSEEYLVDSMPELATELSSAFDLENFQTLLLPSLENKPVDQSALLCVRNMLRENGSRILASHVTRMDLEITVGDNASAANWRRFGLGVSSAIEMCVLPQGRQVRLDIIERAECLKLLVAVTILTCPNDSERAETLHKWIQVAIDIKTALGNLFGFSAIMLGLCLPQVQRLSSTWHMLRQKFTDSAFNYEAKLRPTLKSMNECTNPQAPNTTIPHVLPFVLLQELTLDDILGVNVKPGNSLSSGCPNLFESTLDSGLSTTFDHLESGRKFAKMIPFYRRNAEIILGDSKVDELLLDMFRTEFQLKFLWGSRGSTVRPEERHAKFDQVLTVMSEKCEPSVDGGKV